MSVTIVSALPQTSSAPQANGVESMAGSDGGSITFAFADILLGKQLGQLFLIARNSIKAVVHFGKRVTHGFFIGVQRLVTLGLGNIHLRIQRLAVQQRGENTAPDAPELKRVVQQAGQGAILYRSCRGQVDRRQQAGARRGKRGVCRNQLSFGLNDIRSTVQERRRQL